MEVRFCFRLDFRIMSGKGGWDNVQRNHQSAFVGTDAKNPPGIGLVAGTDVGTAKNHNPRIRRFGTRKVLFLRVRFTVSAQTVRKSGMLGICAFGLRGSYADRWNDSLSENVKVMSGAVRNQGVHVVNGLPLDSRLS